jgi:hypothetical protein
MKEKRKNSCQAPAPSPLNRCDDLNLPARHVTIHRNSHMTHTLIKSARRPLPDGYALTTSRDDPGKASTVPRL